MATPEKTPAIGVSTTCNINGDRQVVLQGYVAADAPREEQDKLLDLMMALTDRQKAKYELIELEDALDKHKIARGRLLQDRDSVEVNYQLATAKNADEIANLDREASEARDAGYKEHAASGRSGPYSPKGGTLSSLNRLGAARQSVEARIKTAEAEKANALGNYEVNLGRFDQEIAAVEAKIGKAQALIGA